MSETQNSVESTTLNLDTAGFIKKLKAITAPCPGVNAPEKAKKVYVLYTPDSLDALVTASMIRRLKWLYESQRHDNPHDGKDSYEIIVESINDASIPVTTENVIWLGMTPTHAVFNHHKPKIPKTVNNICIAEGIRVYDGSSHLSRRVDSALQRQAVVEETVGEYGMILASISKLDELMTLSAFLPEIATSDFIDWMIAEQQVIKFFNQPLTSLDVVYQGFIKGVEAMRILEQAGGLINIDDPKAAYKQVLGTVRAQLKKSGHQAKSKRKDLTIVSWFSHISEFYWVARRQVSASYKYYMNITMCRTGAMTYTNIHPDFSVTVNSEIIRSA